MSEYLQDSHDRYVAEQQKQLIEEIWHERGYHKVKAWIAYVPAVYECGSESARKSGAWIVRSNLVNGIPPK